MKLISSKTSTTNWISCVTQFDRISSCLFVNLCVILFVSGNGVFSLKRSKQVESRMRRGENRKRYFAHIDCLHTAQLIAPIFVRTKATAKKGVRKAEAEQMRRERKAAITRKTATSLTLWKVRGKTGRNGERWWISKQADFQPEWDILGEEVRKIQLFDRKVIHRWYTTRFSRNILA